MTVSATQAPGPTTAADALILRELSAAYGRRAVLHRITTRVPRARTTAVVGPNGSGKSTLLGLLAGVVRPAAGHVERPDPGARRAAFVVQRSEVADTLPITVRETVAMGRWARRGAWRRLTTRDRAVVDSCMRRLGILDLASRQLGALSGGQRQRALVAQGLAQEADLLLLDEPATGLDLDARRRIRDVLDEERARGVTVLHTTHDLTEATRADHCLLLAHGRLLAAGPPDSVLTQDALQRAWGLPVIG